jgi:hypothetical protein
LVAHKLCNPLVPVIINAPLVVAAELRKYGVVGAGGVTVDVTVPDTACVALACAAGIGSVAYVHCTNLHDCVPLTRAVALTRNLLSAFTDASHAYAGCADKAPVTSSIVFAFVLTACTANQFVSPVDSILHSKVQFTHEKVPVQNIIRFEALETSHDTVPPATGVPIVA